METVATKSSDTSQEAEEVIETVLVDRDCPGGRLEVVNYSDPEFCEKDKNFVEIMRLDEEKLQGIVDVFEVIDECYETLDALTSRSDCVSVKELLLFAGCFFESSVLTKVGRESLTIRGFGDDKRGYAHHIFRDGESLGSVYVPLPKNGFSEFKSLVKYVINESVSYLTCEEFGYERQEFSEKRRIYLGPDGYILKTEQFIEHTLRKMPGGVPDWLRAMYRCFSDDDGRRERLEWASKKYDLLEFCKDNGQKDCTENLTMEDLASKDVVFGPRFYNYHVKPFEEDIAVGVVPNKSCCRVLNEAVLHPQMFLPMPKKATRKVSEAEWSELREKHPNFYEVTEYARAFVKRSELTNTPFRMPPILLDGPPGSGKTAFARKLAKVLGLPAQLESAQNIMEGFDLVGTSQVYSNSGPGIVFKAISQAECLNPIIILDEIDKPGSSHREGPSVENTMLSLLERETSETLMEHFFRTEFDASWISWIMTCNDSQLCPSHLRSRLKIFSIKKPNQDEIADVIQSIYEKVMAAEEMSEYFEAKLNAMTLHKLKQYDLRDIKRRIEHGLNQKIMEAESLTTNMAIAPHHLEESKKHRNIFR